MVKGMRANRKRCEPHPVFGAGNGFAQLAKTGGGSLFRPLFLWFISFGGAKEMNIISLKAIR